MKTSLSVRLVLPLVMLLLLFSSLSNVQAAGWQTIVTGPSAAAESSGLAKLKRLFNSSSVQTEPLPPEQAFTAKLRVRDASTLIVAFSPATDYYLYRDRISFNISQPAAAQIAAVRMPAGDMKSDPTFGSVAVFHAPFEALLSLKRIGESASTVRIKFSYQGCSNLGICYPPVQQSVDIRLPPLTATALSSLDSSTEDESNVLSNGEPLVSQGNVKSLQNWLNVDADRPLFQSKSTAWVIVGFFALGLLLSLTPCIWPMIPILSGIIAGQGVSISKTGSFLLSASYVLGMAFTYTGIGIAAGLSGSLLSSAVQTPWVMSAMALVFVILALSTFGLYELRLPAFLQSGVVSKNGNGGKRSMVSVFAMGAISAVVVGPCIAAPLAAALLYIGQTQDVALGGAALFSLALGKGVPLLIIGTSLGGVLPRAGAWMQSIKVFLGMLLLATAVWTISALVPVAFSMAMTAMLLIGYAMYLGTPGPLRESRSKSYWIANGAAVVALGLGAIYLAGAISGSKNFLRPLAFMSETSPNEQLAPLAFEQVHNVEELRARLRDANGRHVMVDIYADWCVSCKEMELFTFSDPIVRERLGKMLLLKLDVTANSALDKQLLAHFGLFGPPAILFFDPEGREVRQTRVIGFMGAREFGDLLEKVRR